MDFSLHYVASSGFVLLGPEGGVAVDAPNGEAPPYTAMDRQAAEALCDGKGAYGAVSALLYTHCHADHFDAAMARRFAESGRAVFAPEAGCPAHGTLTGPGWRAEFFRVPHSGAEYRDTPHCTYLVTAGGKTLYFAGDADYSTGEQAALLRNRSIDAAFYNPIYTFCPENIALMHAIGAKRNYICHLPGEPGGGIRKKTDLCRCRYEALLEGTVYLTACPQVIGLF